MAIPTLTEALRKSTLIHKRKKSSKIRNGRNIPQSNDNQLTINIILSGEKLNTFIVTVITFIPYSFGIPIYIIRSLPQTKPTYGIQI